MIGSIEIGDSPLFLTNLLGYRFAAKKGLAALPMVTLLGVGDVRF